MRESVCVCGRIVLCRVGEGRRPLPKYNKMAGLGMKSSVKELFVIFKCTTLRKKKNKQGVGFENEATLQVKVGGLLVCVTLCWRPRILLYNGLSTFFYYNIIYLNFPLTKQNSGAIDQWCQNRLSASLFVFVLF